MILTFIEWVVHFLKFVAILFLILLVVLLVVLFVVVPIRGVYKDYTYPKEYFANKLEIEHVIASKKYHSEGLGMYGCTYVIVKYKDGSSPKLVSSLDKKILTNKKSSFRPWLGNWKKTPLVLAKRSANSHQRHFDMDTIKCLNEVSPKLYKDILALLSTKGSWYLTGRDGIFSFTSEVSNIAIHIWYSG